MSAYRVTGAGVKRQVHFECERCGAELASPLAEAGQRFPCPTCGTPFTTPGTAELEADPHGSVVVATATRRPPPAPGRPGTVAYASAAADEARFPGIVLAAGIIWIVVGAPIVLVAAVLFLLTLAVGGGGGLLLVGATLLVGGFGGAFVSAGIKTVRGTAGDTLGNGIGSIVFGLLFGGLSLNPSRGSAGVALLVAGILALVGRAKYQAWQTRGDRQRRPRRVVA